MQHPENDLAYIDKIAADLGRGPGQTIALLNAIQEHYHYLPQAALERLCAITEITPAQAAGAATFYNRYRLTPSGRHRIKVCVGTACHVKGAESVYNGFRQFLEIDDEQDTDAGGLFTVEKVACLGCCMLAPAVQIDSHIYGHVDRQAIPGIIRNFLKSGQITGKHKNGKVPAPGKNGNGEIRICTCSSCRAAGAFTVYKEIQNIVQGNGLDVQVKEVGCTGISYKAPLVSLVDYENNTFHYGQVAPGDMRQIIQSHFKSRGIHRALLNLSSLWLDKLYTGGTAADVIRCQVHLTSLPDSLYWGKQQHLVTCYAGKTDPLDFAGYTGNGGFAALKQVLQAGSRTAVLEQLRSSGLRGRGGAGFPAALKWEKVMSGRGAVRYVICNGDEGDPGAFMDRMILESFPFRVIEGILIACYTVQADRGFLYIRSEYPLAIRRIKAAIEICREQGLIGGRVMGTDFALQLEVVEGAGAFICGEETALIAAIQGGRGIPLYKPPYPAEQGLWGAPTLVNNVETLACVPWIVREGGAAFAAIGTAGSKGTKTFSLAGKIRRGGLIEVPMGITLHDIVYDIGGGIQDDKILKAIQIGGPSGGCLPAALVHTPVDFDALLSAGAIMGSGGIVVLDESDCMVEIARYFMSFTQAESCGKCTYCRIGTMRMLELLTRLTEGKGKPGDIEQLIRLGTMVKERSVCGLGRTAPNPVLSTLHYFRGEYEAHIAGICPAGKCKALITYRITERCIGCTLCARSCPAEAIRGEPFAVHTIDPAKCLKCDTCRRLCPEKAVAVEPGKGAFS